MNLKQIYTTLSRTTKIEHIHLDTAKLLPCYESTDNNASCIVKSYFNDDYHYGKIYKIRYEYNDKLYVGSSIRNLQERLQEHLTTKSSPVYKYKDDGPIIHSITTAPCKDRQELNKVEIEYIRQYSNKYGDRLLNKKSVPKQTVKIIR